MPYQAPRGLLRFSSSGWRGIQAPVRANRADHTNAVVYLPRAFTLFVDGRDLLSTPQDVEVFARIRTLDTDGNNGGCPLLLSCDLSHPK
jgi:hypothetical protein